MILVASADVIAVGQGEGELVVDTTGTIRHAHRYQHCEDHPEPLVVIAGDHVTAATITSVWLHPEPVKETSSGVGAHTWRVVGAAAGAAGVRS